MYVFQSWVRRHSDQRMRFIFFELQARVAETVSCYYDALSRLLALNSETLRVIVIAPGAIY